jgi:hypothetical protein
MGGVFALPEGASQGACVVQVAQELGRYASLDTACLMAWHDALDAAACNEIVQQSCSIGAQQ